MKDSGRFPLWSSRDIREVAGSANGLTEYTNTDTSNVLLASVAYHLHNWFDDLAVLRNKYKTYGHYDDKWANNPSKVLSKINRELDLVVRCTRDLGNDLGEDKYYEEHELNDGRYNLPIYFLNTTYSRERHELVKELVRQDEETFGSSYAQDGTELNAEKQDDSHSATQQSNIDSPEKSSSEPVQESKRSVLRPRTKLMPQSFKVR